MESVYLGEMANVRVFLVRQIAIRHAVEAEYRRQHHLLRRLLPRDSVIEHVGATSIPYSLTKGDLDIQVRVPRSNFRNAVTALSRNYSRNKKSKWTAEFAAFEDSRRQIPVGVQLTVTDSPLDIFWRFRDALRGKPSLRAQYDALKRRHAGNNMVTYRRAKNKFINKLQRRIDSMRLSKQNAKSSES